jgi:hypothetical protein
MIIDFNEEEIAILLEITGTNFACKMADGEECGDALVSVKTKLKEALYTAYESDATGFKS